MKRLFVFAAILALAGCRPQELSTIETEYFGTDLGAIEVPLGEFFLIRMGEEHAAVKLTATTGKGDGGVEYTWYYQSSGSGLFTDESATSGEGEAFEKYRRVKESADSTHLEDDGGVLHIVCDKLKVQWSMSNWIYFDTPRGPVEIALTDKSDIEEINYMDAALIWRAGKVPGEKDADPGGE